MEKIVYVLGAGFSAPLGLPVIKNFRDKATELYDKEPEKYAYFNDIINKPREMAATGNYFETNLFDIEEMLSIHQMKTTLDGESAIEPDITNFIIDVIKANTPPMPAYQRIDSPWLWHSFGQTPIWRHYALFVGALAQIELSKEETREGGNFERKIRYKIRNKDDIEYSIITFNYDLIVETVGSFIKQAGGEFPVLIRNPQYFKQGLPLAKLHGSIEDNTIIQPTWNKSLQEKILPDWRLALKILTEATQIRFIGYSLPEGDAYARYLFKAAGTDALRLKKVDVLCLDNSGDVKSRYEKFVKKDHLTFKSANIKDYLELHQKAYDSRGSDPTRIMLDKLETTHQNFMNKEAER